MHCANKRFIGDSIGSNENPSIGLIEINELWRPPKLDGADREVFRAAVRRLPTAVGYDHPACMIAFTQQFLEDEFDLEYSRHHVQRLLKEAGLTAGDRGRNHRWWDENPKFWKRRDVTE